MLGICKLGGRKSENEKCLLCQKDENGFNLPFKLQKIKKMGRLTFEA
jgi:hypothetical protein